MFQDSGSRSFGNHVRLAQSGATETSGPQRVAATSSLGQMGGSRRVHTSTEPPGALTLPSTIPTVSGGDSLQTAVSSPNRHDDRLAIGQVSASGRLSYGALPAMERCSWWRNKLNRHCGARVFVSESCRFEAPGDRLEEAVRRLSLTWIATIMAVFSPGQFSEFGLRVVGAWT